MKQPIPNSILHKFNDANGFATLRVWVVLKQLDRNTIIYNLNYAELSARTGISHMSLRTHIKRMVAEGLAKHQNGHLHLTGINKLKKHENEKCVLVPVERTKAAQIAQFQKAIIHQNIRNQEKQINRKRRIVTQCNRPHGKVNKADLKLIAKSGGVKNFESSIQSVTTLSNRTIGKMFGNKSQLSGHRIQKKLRSMGLITTKARFEVYKAVATKFDAKYLNCEFGGGYIFNYSNGSVYRRLTNEVCLPMQ